MNWLRIPGLKLKSVSALDDMYVDEEGKHIIFRQIGGRTVPIRTDAEGYASWLSQQGVDIDPADQKTLRELEKQLDVFDQARTAGGPELQEEYQKAFVKQLKQQQQLVQKYYQQALQNQAKKKETTPEKLQEAKKQTYEENKESLVDRKQLDDRGWGSYIQGFTDKLIQNANAKPDDKLYHALRAVDLVLMKSIARAKEGVEPSKLDMIDLINEELQDLTTFKELYGTRYVEMAKAEGFDPSLFLANMHSGLQILKDNIEQGTAGGKDLSDSFNAIYRKTHDDFNQEKEDNFRELSEGMTLGTGVEKLPTELPETMGSKEASALKHFYKKSKGSPLNGSHKVALHSLGRIFDSIPDDEKVRAAIELSDQQKGLHAVHKESYKNAYRMSEGFGMDLGMDEALDQMLREAVKASYGTTTDKIIAMKRIAQTLGTLDGLFLVKRDNKGFQSHVLRWQQSSVNAGRAKGEGPDLVSQVIDENNRKANTYSNRVLKIPHQDVPSKPKKPDLTNLEGSDEPAKQSPVEKKKGEVYPGYTAREGKIYSSDGYSVEVVGKQWNVYTPEGDKIGVVAVNTVKPSEIERAKEAAFSGVNDVINNHKKSQTSLEQDEEAQRSTPEFPAFDFKAQLSDSERKVIESINPDEFEISTITPGTTYRVSQGGKSLDLIHAKDKLLIGYKDEATGGMHVEDATPEAVQKYFSAQEEEAPDEDEEPQQERLEDKPYEGDQKGTVSNYFRENELKELIEVVGADNLGWKHFRDDSYQVKLPQEAYNDYIAYKDAQSLEKKSVTNRVYNFK